MEKIELNVKGMMCEGCENRIKNVVKSIDGVSAVKADHTLGKVEVELKKEVDAKVIKEKIEDIGYEVIE